MAKDKLRPCESYQGTLVKEVSKKEWNEYLSKLSKLFATLSSAADPKHTIKIVKPLGRRKGVVRAYVSVDHPRFMNTLMLFPFLGVCYEYNAGSYQSDAVNWVSNRTAFQKKFPQAYMDVVLQAALLGGCVLKVRQQKSIFYHPEKRKQLYSPLAIDGTGAPAFLIKG